MTGPFSHTSVDMLAFMEEVLFMQHLKVATEWSPWSVAACIKPLLALQTLNTEPARAARNVDWRPTATECLDMGRVEDEPFADVWVIAWMENKRAKKHVLQFAKGIISCT